MFGNQSETSLPDFPYRVKVRRMGMTGRCMGATLSPNPTASINLPAHLLSFGSNVSMWLTPPHMYKKMTDLAFTGSVGAMRTSGIRPSSAHMEPSAPPMKQPMNPAADLNNSRRPIRPHGKILFKSLITYLTYFTNRN